jgi:hypothetical protein
MTQREQLLIKLFQIDAEFCDRAQSANELAVAAESRVGFRFCSECGRKFIPEHPASKFCSQLCRSAPERRRYRTRVGRA